MTKEKPKGKETEEITEVNVTKEKPKVKVTKETSDQR